MKQQILASIIQVASCTFLLFAALLWMRRNNNRSRVYFSVAYGVCGLDLFLRIFGLYGVTPFTFEVLQPAALYMVLIEIPLFLFYLIEVVNPGSLTLRKAVGMCAPWLLWNICLLIPGLHFRELHTFGDIFRHIGEANVWLRLLFAMLILPYNIIVYMISYNWRRSIADRGFIRIFVGGFIVMALFFVGSLASGLITVSGLHLLYGTLFCFCTAYYELFIRLQMPEEVVATANCCVSELAPAEIRCFANAGTDKAYQPEDRQKTEDKAVTNQQWNKISREIENRQLWRNHDISIVTLADLLQTNRTTLSRLFQEQGYNGGYKEFINRRRIADFLELMDKNPQMNMQDAFFEAGYQSRMTALRNFKEYIGTSPSEYFNNRTNEK